MDNAPIFVKKFVSLMMIASVVLSIAAMLFLVFEGPWYLSLFNVWLLAVMSLVFYYEVVKEKEVSNDLG